MERDCRSQSEESKINWAFGLNDISVSSKVGCIDVFIDALNFILRTNAPARVCSRFAGCIFAQLNNSKSERDTIGDLR